MFQSKSVKTMVLASAVAGLFAAGASTPAFAEEKSEAKVACEGVNECKGHGSCKTARNACSGQNGCAGQGVVMMTKAECDAAKAKKAQGK